MNRDLESIGLKKKNRIQIVKATGKDVLIIACLQHPYWENTTPQTFDCSAAIMLKPVSSKTDSAVPQLGDKTELSGPYLELPPALL